jgi:multicomponent K+:H+ antiporter subunit D
VLFAKPLQAYLQATAEQLLDVDLYRRAILAGGGA